MSRGCGQVCAERMPQASYLFIGEKGCKDVEVTEVLRAPSGPESAWQKLRVGWGSGLSPRESDVFVMMGSSVAIHPVLGVVAAYPCASIRALPCPVVLRAPQSLSVAHLFGEKARHAS